MSDFNTELNIGYHQNVQDTQSNIVSDVAGGVVATVVDAGASLWNSLPGTTEVSTESLLGDISDNALRVYTENPDLIHAASFIGTSFIPGGLALKGMNAMRNGSKAVNWFTKLGKEADMAKVADMFKAGAEGTKDYRAAVRGLYAKTAVNQAIDAAAMEVAVLGTLNASPMVEDYMKDPLANFGISVAFGGVLGGAIGTVADHYALRQVTGKISEAALNNTLGRLKPIFPDMPNAVALQIQDVNIKSLEAIIQDGKAAGVDGLNDITMQMAEKLRLNTIKEADNTFKKIVSQEILDLPTTTQEIIKQRIMSSPEMFGVEKITPVKAGDVKELVTQTKPAGFLDKTPVLREVKRDDYEETITAKKAVFFQELGLYGVMSDIKHYGGASVLYESSEQALKGMGKSFARYPDHDTGLSLLSKSAPQVQAEYVAAMAAVMKMKPAELMKLQVAPTDSAMLNALKYRMSVDEEFAAIGVKFADDKAYNIAVEAEKLPKPESYSFANTVNIEKFNPERGAAPDRSKAMLRDWRIGGKGMHDMRLGAEEFKRAGYTVSRANQDSALAELETSFRGIYESQGSIALRTEFAKVADGDGYVYLWRGSRSTNDRAGVRSYSTLKDKAEEFGAAKLYKVKVTDIIAGIQDNGHKGYQPEILVLEGERTPAGLSLGKRAELSATVTPNTVTKDLLGVNDALIQNQVSEINSLLSSGVPLESIALKTNLELDVVKNFIGVPVRDSGALLDSMQRFNAKSGKFPSVLGSPEDYARIFEPSMRPLVLEGNVIKPQYSAAAAGMDSKALADMSSEITSATLYASKNDAAVAIADLIYAPGHEETSMRYVVDMMKAELGKGNNQNSGNAFVNSFDFYSRNMGSLGPMVSEIGKRISRITNQYIDKINIPIAEAMADVGKSPVDTIEFNTFREVNAGLSGWRQFKDGKIWQRVERTGLDGKPTTVLEAVQYNGKDYVVQTDSVKNAVNTIQKQSPELLSLINANRRIQGIQDAGDIGLWIPSLNPVNKFIAYVHDATTDGTKLIWANTKAEYDQIVRNYKQNLAATGQDKNIRVVEKGVEQELWSRLNGRLDTMQMTVADSSAKKSGSSGGALVRADNQVFGEIAGGYEHFINSQVRTMADLAMADLTHQLDSMSKLNRGTIDSQPLTGVKKFLEGDKDTAAVLKNTLLGSPSLGEYAGWKSLNESFETGLALASSTVAKVWDTATKPLTKTFLGGRKEIDTAALAKLDYESIATQLEKQGVVNPWANFDAAAAEMYGLSKLSDSPDTSKRIVFASNALAATVALRVGELAQPLVNIMSLPILTGLAAATKMPETFMGVAKGTAKVSGTQIVMEGARAANSPLWASLGKKAEELGYFDAMVSESNKTLRTARSMDRGAIASIEKALDSRMVEVLSKPADWSEAFTRRQTFFTGAVLGKRLYPELGDDGLMIFARDFMDKAIGNFNAAQRPVFFQGTLGVALGLFQTYSLTLGQSIYRQLELKNYKALGKAALTQSTVFGIGSMPGFQAVSQGIGEHFSDDHVDLTTGTYRALDDDMAKAVLYGLPSLAGLGTHSRGDASFRVPGLSGDNVVALNFAKQASQAVGTVISAMGEGSNAGQAMLQAISLQNMSRPLARGAELASGYSVTRQGNTVQTPAEVWTTAGIMSRIIGTRPAEEAKLREAMHLNTYYGSIDRDNRAALMGKLKTGIRNGSLTEPDIEKYAHEYMRNNGTPTGWRSAFKTALATTETSGKEVFADKLRPDNPTMFMMDNLD